jgi:hypothetical protein
MNIFGVDLTLVPWPIFLLLVCVGGAYIWYLNVFVPLVAERDSLKNEENVTINLIKLQVNTLTQSVNDMTEMITNSTTNQSQIIAALGAIDNYSANLIEFSKLIKNTEDSLTDKIDVLDTSAHSLTHILDDLKDKSAKKSKI